MKKRLFFFCAISIVIGILLGTWAKEFLICFLFPLLFLPFAFIKKKLTLGAVILLFVISLVNSSCAYREIKQEIPSASFSGIVSDVYDGELKSFIVSDVTVVTKEQNSTSLKRVFVSFSGENLPRVGEKVQITATLYPYAKTAQNQGEQSTHVLALADDIFFRAYSTNFARISSKTTVKSIIYSLKGVIFDKIFSATDNKEAAAILYAFLTGDRAYISGETVNLFKSSGTSHLLALSGLHTGIILLVLSKLLDLLRCAKKPKLIIIGTFLILFCAFTGFSPSIIRASVMASVLLFCSAFGFRYDLLNSLSLTACIILLFNPYRLFDPSFLLSFSAVLGIACLPNVKIKNRIFAKIYSALSVTLGATIFTLPLSLYYFSSVSLVSVIFNLIMVPIASVALFLLVIFIFLPVKFLSVPVFLIEVLLRVADFSANIEPLKVLCFNALWVPAIMLCLFALSKYVRLLPLFKGIITLLLCISIIFAPFLKDNSPKINVLANTRELFVHVKAKKNIVIGLDLSPCALSYIKSNMRKIDVAVLLDSDDVLQFELCHQQGISILSVIAPMGALIDTELEVSFLAENEIKTVDDLIFYYKNDGVYLLLNGTPYFFGGISDFAYASIFHYSEQGATEHKVLSGYTMLTTLPDGMITIKDKKFSTFLGE